MSQTVLTYKSFLQTHHWVLMKKDQLSKAQYSRFLQGFTLISVQAFSHIYEVGDVANAVYIVIEGHGIQLKIIETARQMAYQNPQKRKNGIKRFKANSIDPSRQSLNNLDIFISQVYPEFSIERQYKVGDVIGQQFLLSPAKTPKRHSLSLALQDLKVMKFGQVGLIKKISLNMRSKQLQKCRFLKNFSFFEKLTFNQFIGYMGHFKLRKYKFKQLIYQQNEKISDVYFVLRGEVCLLKKIQGSKYPFEIASIVQQACFGFQQVLMKKNIRQSSAVCKSVQVILYSLSQKMFMQLNKDKQSLQNLTASNNFYRIQQTNKKQQLLGRMASQETLLVQESAYQQRAQFQKAVVDYQLLKQFENMGQEQFQRIKANNLQRICFFPEFYQKKTKLFNLRNLSKDKRYYNYCNDYKEQCSKLTNQKINKIQSFSQNSFISNSTVTMADYQNFRKRTRKLRKHRGILGLWDILRQIRTEQN